MGEGHNKDDVVSEIGVAKSYEREYTYGDYLNWSDEERWEIIDGQAYNLTPAPSRQHQKVLGNLHTIINIYLKDKDCDVYIAPFDVRLPRFKGQEDEDITDVVQPDLVVICDSSKLDNKGCKGAPDLAVEVLSPSTAPRDLKVKLSLYERKGVQEYWLIHPVDKTVMVYELNADGKYDRPDIYVKDDRIKVGILKELVIDLEEVFVE